jgi:hypothetical protein
MDTLEAFVTLAWALRYLRAGAPRFGSVGWVPTSQPVELTSVRSGTFKIQNILRVPTARQFDQGKRPEVCPFTDNRQDTNILLGFGCGGTWPEYLASGSDKIRKRVSKCDMIVTSTATLSTTTG